MFSLKPIVNQSKKHQASLTTCPRCNRIPLISFVKNNPQLIQVVCDCSYNKTYDLEEYLSITQTDRNSFNEHYCKVHVNEAYMYYCETCLMHICPLCLPIHKQHKMIKLKDYFNEDKLKKIEDNIKKARQHLNDNYRKVKDNLISELRNQIEKIQLAYEENNKINQNMLALIETLIRNYKASPFNYYSMTNIMNNTQFNFRKLNGFTNDISFSNITKLISFYQHNHIIKSKNIDIDQFFTVKTIQEHNSNVYTLIVLSDGRLASCSWDFSIKIYNSSNYDCELTIENAHKDYVNSITELPDGKLVSCSSDTSISIWSLGQKEYKLITSFKKHKSVVFKVITLTNNRFASCSYDNSIKIYSANSPYAVVATLEGHTGSVRSILQIQNKELLVSGSDDDTLCFWDTQNYLKLHSIDDVSCSYHQSLIEIKNNLIAVGGYATVFIVNYKTFSIQTVIQDDYLNCVNCFLPLDDGTLLCGCQFGRVCNLDLNTFEWVFKKKDFISTCITSLVKISKRSFVMSSYDRAIYIVEY